MTKHYLPGFTLSLSRKSIKIAEPDGMTVAYAIQQIQSWSGPPTAVLFDVDGTSLLSEEFWVQILSTTLIEAGGPADGLAPTDFIALRGGTVSAHLGAIRKIYNLSMEVPQLEELYGEVVDRMFHSRGIEDLCREMPIANGLAFMVDNLNYRGIPFGFVTNGARRKAARELAVINRHLLAQGVRPTKMQLWASPSHGSGEIQEFGGMCGKPHPWPYLEAARAFSSTSENRRRILAVDDTVVGLISARAAGLTPVAIGHCFHEDELVDRISLRRIQYLDELAPVINGP